MKKWALDRITLIEAEWNCYNGFTFNLLWVDLRHRDGALFTINASKNFLYIGAFFLVIKFFDKTDHSKF